MWYNINVVNSGAIMTGKTAFIRARIEPSLKYNVEIILEQLGLNSTEAIRLFYRQIEIYKGLPFQIKIPNAQTRKAINDNIAGKNQKRFSNVEELFEDLED
jgi:DNA-damage-inducible protein J